MRITTPPRRGVILLCKTMALELAPAIRVNAICPGYVLTPMQKAEYTPEMLEATNPENSHEASCRTGGGGGALCFSRLFRGRLYYRSGDSY